MNSPTKTYKVNLKLGANKAFLKHLACAIKIDEEILFQFRCKYIYPDVDQTTSAYKEYLKSVSVYISIMRQIRSQLECFDN